MTHDTFNLVNHPWLPVIIDGKRVTVSLDTLYCLAPNIQRLDIADPLEHTAIIRLLLSIMYRTNHGGVDENTVHTLLRHPDPKPVIEYLQTVENRFDIMDEDNPFMQTPHMTPQNSSIRYGLTRLHPQNQRALWWRTNAYKPVSPRKAARMLVTCNAYDVAGIHTGMKDDPEAKAGKSTGRGVASAGGLLIATVQGRNLWETLLLNLPPASDTGMDDKPIWEYEPLTPRIMDDAQPTGPAFAYTYPSRRIRLVWNDDGDCVEAYVTNGNRSLWDPESGLDPDKAPACEPMAVWENDGKKKPVARPYTGCSKKTIDRPVWTMWERTMTREHRPRNLDWALRFNDTIRFTMTGVMYGSQSATVAAIRHETMTVTGERLDADERNTGIVSALVRKAWPRYVTGENPHTVWAEPTHAMGSYLAGGEEPQQ